MSYIDKYIEAGRKGGLARGKKYWTKISAVVTLFVNRPDLSQSEIAKRVDVSQAFVSKYTNFISLKKSRLENQISGTLLEDKELESLLLKIKMDINLDEKQQKKKPYKI
ncbi:hypothetical protein WJ968_21080 [Achromobacter xylosoxidans]